MCCIFSFPTIILFLKRDAVVSAALVGQSIFPFLIRSRAMTSQIECVSSSSTSLTISTFLLLRRGKINLTPSRALDIQQDGSSHFWRFWTWIYVLLLDAICLMSLACFCVRIPEAMSHHHSVGCLNDYVVSRVVARHILNERDISENSLKVLDQSWKKFFATHVL